MGVVVAVKEFTCFVKTCGVVARSVFSGRGAEEEVLFVEMEEP